MKREIGIVVETFGEERTIGKNKEKWEKNIYYEMVEVKEETHLGWPDVIDLGPWSMRIL